jgi:mannosyltransferase
LIYIDGVVFSLQSNGGISVLFRELISRLPRDIYRLGLYSANKKILSSNEVLLNSRCMERYRDVCLSKEYSLFHSSYYRIPKKPRCKVVTTVHDFVYEKYFSGFKRSVHAFQKKRAVDHSDIVICVSESTKNDLLQIYGSKYEEKVVVIHNGVSNDYFFTNRDINNGADQVLFVGSRAGYKNFTSSVIAISELTDIKFLLVGGGALKSNELNFLKKHLPGRFKHVEYLSNADLNKEYNRSLALLYPSSYEGFGIPVLEAMKAGCPVIASNSSSIPEVAGDAAILMERSSAEEIKFSLNRLLDSDFRSELVRRGLLQAKHFSWDNTYNETIDVYKLLLGDSGLAL